MPKSKDLFAEIKEQVIIKFCLIALVLSLASWLAASCEEEIFLCGYFARSTYTKTAAESPAAKSKKKHRTGFDQYDVFIRI